MRNRARTVPDWPRLAEARARRVPDWSRLVEPCANGSGLVAPGGTVRGWFWTGRAWWNRAWMVPDWARLVGTLARSVARRPPPTERHHPALHLRAHTIEN